MKKLSFFILVAFACFSSCTKDSIDNSFYSNTLLSQINSGEVAILGVRYNSNHLIYESTEPYLYKKYSYDQQNRLKKVEQAYSFNPFSCAMIPGASAETDPRKAEISQYSDFEYNNVSKLIKKSNYFINSGTAQLTSYQTYDYENNTISKIKTYNPQGLLIQVNEYQYDENGNITKDDLYSNQSTLKLLQSSTYEFDDKKNPYQVYAAEGIPGSFTNKNNTTKKTDISYNETSETQYTQQITYEYNDLGYPIKVNGMVYKYGK